ncbi:DUF1223 domain-containing protein [Sagittula sp. SSi028]|uniref:DUF1223 domain-containing protein n=1 Tax=Sagittula sp. SSi028 TaxID=3400636 RepID=UPI003AF52ABD
MRGILTYGAAVWMGLGVALAGAAPAAADDTNPVVVELFTSQGCSSCPPADKFLAELGERHDVIALAYHVDYWDYIGWKDRFASPEFTRRQKGYARARGWKMVYTPQMVVNGYEDVVGSRTEEVEALIDRHQDQTGPAKLMVERRGDKVVIRAQGDADGQPCDIHVIRYNPAEEVYIKRGENAGRTMNYTHIVREWDVAARWNGRGDFETEVSVAANEPVVVLLQAPKSGPILAAAQID